jgi:hypothetical protein
MAFVGRMVFQKVTIVSFFFLKSSEQKSKVQIFGCCNQNSQQDKVQHQERIDRSLNGELKDLMIIIKVERIDRSLNGELKDLMIIIKV